METDPLQIPVKQFPLVAGGPFLGDARLFFAAGLLNVKPVFESVSRRHHLDLEFLRSEIKPIGEFQALDVLLAFASKIDVPGGKIPDQLEHVEHRTLACPVRAAKDAEGIELSLEGDQAPKVVCVKPSDHVRRIMAFGLMSIFPAYKEMRG